MDPLDRVRFPAKALQSITGFSMDYLKNIVVLDTETTNVNPSNGAILSVGMVCHNSSIKTFYNEYYPFDGAEYSRSRWT